MPDIRDEVRNWRKAVASIPIELSWLASQVVLEVNDENFISLRHGERHTYNMGCRGPICKKAKRDDKRNRKRRNDRLTGVVTRQYARSTVLVVADPVIAIVKRAHDKEFDTRPKGYAELQTA